MRRLGLISIDLLFVACATVLAVMLRGTFDTVPDALMTAMPYLLISMGCACMVFLVGGLDRTPWRYSSVADHLQIIVLTALVTLLTVALSFAANRLEGIARSLPVLQGALIVTFLISARCVARFWYARKTNKSTNGHIDGLPHETVLVVGVNAVSELFITSAQELAFQQVQVAGVLAEEPTMRGRAIRQTPILGTVEELPTILESLEVHGTMIDRIVVATARDWLQPRALQTLFEVENGSSIVVHFLSERLGFEDSRQPVSSEEARNNSVPLQGAGARAGNVADGDYANSPARSFRFVKRTVDVFGAAFLILMLTPVAALAALVVALDVGFPLLFWQQRPGLYGRPFKLYKFRTMRAPHDRHLKRIPDDKRSSRVGQILRRTRLDELPQLYNVLIGNMSLIGPRPLLPRDQSSDYAARLLVRPGITGWAQVNGGRIISPCDKCTLDIWYVQNASLVLDLEIVLRTIKMMVFGDRINAEALYRAQTELDLTTAPLRTTIAPAK